MFGNSRQHLWANLIFVMKSKDHIRPTGTEKNFMRTGFAFDVPSDAEKGGENAFCFGRKTIGSCGGEVDVQKFGSAFGVFEPICQGAQGKSLRLRDCFIRRLPIGKHAGKFKHLSQPAAIILTLKFDGECHTVLPRPIQNPER